MAELDFCDGSDGDGSASKDLDLGCHRFMADGLGGRNRHHGTFLSSRFLDLIFLDLVTALDQNMTQVIRVLVVL